MISKDIKQLVKTAKMLTIDFNLVLKFKEGFGNGEFILDSININSAFFPAIWTCLTTFQKLQVIIIASKWHSVSLSNRFCYNAELSNEIFILNEENNKIYFNIASLNNKNIDPIEFLTRILNLNSMKKTAKFRENIQKKHKIIEFKTFEELQHSVKIKQIANFQNISEEAINITKAVYLDQKNLRDYRYSRYSAINYMLDYVKELKLEQLKMLYIEEQNKILNEDNFIKSNLSDSLLERDFIYLKAAANILEKEDYSKTKLIEYLKHFKSHFGNDFIHNKINLYSKQ